LKPDVTTVSARGRHDRNELLNRSVLIQPRQSRGWTSQIVSYLGTPENKRPKPNGFWLVSSDCQRAGTPRPAGRVTDEAPY